jgi:hypothetical protein
MARVTVCIDDQTGKASSGANPDGWLEVTVTEIVGGSQTTLTFEGWESFRHWVETSDPGCGKPLDPGAGAVAKVPTA